MERVPRGVAATIYNTFQVNGTPIDPSPATATIQIVNSAGTELVPAGTATTRVDVGKFGFTLNPASVSSLLDTLTVNWTAIVQGVQQTFSDTVEVAGGFLFSVADMRARLTGTSRTYTDDQIVAMRTTVEQAIEDICAVAFVPRFSLEAVELNGNRLLPRWAKVRAVRSLTIGGLAAAATDALVMPGGSIYYPYTYTRATYSTAYPQQVVLGYEHGHDNPPERIRQAAISWALSWMIRGPVDERSAVFNQDGGTVSYPLAVAGRNGSHTGIPEVDETLRQYSLAVGVA